MKRCLAPRARIALAASLAFATAGLSFIPALGWAQSIQREAPRDVVLGKMAVHIPPEIAIDGKPDRLSPGSRIRDLNNMVVLSSALAGKTLPVVYRRDAAGLVHEAWILTEEEFAKLGGAGSNADPEGQRRFAELLGVMFGARR